jgi:hypothetical protein
MPGGRYYSDALRRRLARLEAEGGDTAERIEATQAKLAAAEKAEGEDLSKLLKADLVDRATAAGIDTEGLSKAELVEALEKGGG